MAADRVPHRGMPLPQPAALLAHAHARPQLLSAGAHPPFHALLHALTARAAVCR